MTQPTVQETFRLFVPEVFSKIAEDLSERRPWNNTIVVAMPPRSGSTVLVSALANAGLASSVWEILNPRGPFPYLLKASNAKSFSDYLGFYFQEMMKTGHFLFKTAFYDFEFFSVEERFRIFSPASFVFVDRKDSLAQAYSLAKARKSDVWHLSADAPLERSAVVPSLEEVKNNLTFVVRERDRWRAFFRNNGIKPYELVYETMCQFPQETVADLYKHITGQALNGKFELSYRKVRDDNDERAVERYRKQLEVS